MYRAWGWLPRESGIWRRFLAWLLGNWQQLLYIGITERTTIARWAEHMKDKDWAPNIACWEREERIYRSEADVLAAETAAIWAERPVHNIAKNGNNPGAVHVRRRLERRVVARRIRLAWLAGMWLVLTLLAWQLVPMAATEWFERDIWVGWAGLRSAAIVASLPYVGYGVKRARARWRRFRRRRR